MQTITVFLIVSFAVAYVGWRVYKTLKSCTEKGGCANCQANCPLKSLKKQA